MDGETKLTNRKAKEMRIKTDRRTGRQTKKGRDTQTDFISCHN